MQNLGDKIEELARAQKATQAASLIGRTVTFTNNDGWREVTGKVKGCEFYGEYVYLTVADEKILFTNVSKISVETKGLVVVVDRMAFPKATGGSGKTGPVLSGGNPRRHLEQLKARVFSEVLRQEIDSRGDKILQAMLKCV